MEQWFLEAPVHAATLANVSKIYLVFQLLDLGLGDRVFDLELLGAEMEENEKGGEERVVRSSNAWLHKLSLYCGYGGWMQTADLAAPAPEAGNGEE